MNHAQCAPITRLTAPLFALAFGLASPTADAGTLGKVGKSIASKQQSSRANASQGSSSRPERRHEPSSYTDHDRPHPGSCFTCQTVGWTAGGVRLRRPARPEVELFLGYENVRNSDGSLNASIRLAHGLIALGADSSSYYESDRLGKGEPEEQTRLTVWDISLQARALQVRDTTTVWIGVGYGQLHSNAFRTVSGGTLSAFARHRLARGLHIEGRARGMIYADDIKAGELRAGVTASVLHVGYRYLEFNAGPPLHGPEIGVSLRF